MNDPQQLLRQRAAKVYATLHGWEYEVICPNDFHPMLKQNLRFLMQFIKPREGLEAVKNEIINNAATEGQKIYKLLEVLAKKLLSKKPNLLPHIYHLVASGFLLVDMFKPIDLKSHVRLVTSKSEAS